MSKYQPLGIGMTPSKTKDSRREQLGPTRKELLKAIRMKLKTASPRIGYDLGKHRDIRYFSLWLLVRVLDLEPSALSSFSTGEKATSSILGQKIRTGRKRLGLSQNELAEELQVDRQYVSQIESGKIPLSLGDRKGDAMIKRLALILQLDIDELQAVRPKRRLKQKKVKRGTLGGFSTARRLELGITQEEVARRVERSPRWVCGVENGRIFPKDELLDRLAKALECEIPLELLPEGPR